MNRVLGIDPGPKVSAWMLFDIDAWLPDRIESDPLGGNFGILPNDELLWTIDSIRVEAGVHLAIEMVGHYGTGMSVGKSIFDTCVWIGRFVQAWDGPHTLLLRKTICARICGSARAGDSNIRQALIDMFPVTGGGKVPQIGTKKAPGPLYGISKDVWSALAVCVAWAKEEKDG